MSPRRGFTLLEVLLVMAVIVMLAAMAYPSIEAMYADVRLNAAADQVRAAWADARTKAIEEGRPYRFAVQPDGQFRIAPDAADFWNGGGTPAAAATDSDTPPLVVEDTLPKGVNFADGGVNGGATDPTAGDSGPWQAVVRFLPDGTASQDVEIVFQAEGGGRPVSLRLRGLTGSVSMPAQPAGRQP